MRWAASSLPIGRAFLVGCPRSGTTLLQSLISAHPDVVSFPETFFFRRTLPAGRFRRHLGLAASGAAGVLDDLDGFGVAADPAHTRLPLVTAGQYARCFTRRMDRSALQTGASLWLEKTPSHARHIPQIERLVARARFIHIVRAGEAVVASIQEASERDPTVWPRLAPLDNVEVWRRYVRYSQICVGRENHAFVSYERLVAVPEAVLTSLSKFLELRIDAKILAALLTGYRASSKQVIGRLVRSDGADLLAREPWKDDVAGALTNRNDAKFRSLFSEPEQERITRAVAQEREAVASLPFL
jgi:hypothetical protein